ncbi:MAG TPA: hypothetical protein DD429_05715, partial [Clostridiaceae bacterium]|nr:hypothetical protein [Clostridiaceae bacterium]
SEIIKHIYREYLEGASIMKIAHGLDADGSLNGSGEERWHTSNISQILWTEKYIGDARTVPESKSSRYWSSQSIRCCVTRMTSSPRFIATSKPY